MEPPASTTEYDDFNIMQHHGLTFHSDLLLSLPNDILNSIQWYKCTRPCNHLAFSKLLLRDHKHQCPTCRRTTTSHQPPIIQPSLPTIPAYNRNDTSATRIRSLWTTCPRQHRQELDELLRSETNIEDITNTVFDWIEQSTYITEGAKSKNE
jgi:hypothetical protein